ncbi:MAG: hypothetical protein HY805_01160 [Nitrospirae bacterium]|nr:hypothetical protein [Nitrospirota bacterium]
MVELETGNPIEGAVVASRWTIEPYVHSERFCDAKETVTDKNGEFLLPRGGCWSHSFAELSPADIVIFKPGYLAYPPLGASQEERRLRMPDFTGYEFRDKKQYYVINLGRPKTRDEKWLLYARTEREEREFTYDDAGSPFIHNEAFEKLPALLKLINEERKNLGLTGEIGPPENRGD